MQATATEQNAPRKNTYYYDPATKDGWVATGDLNMARNGTSAAVLDGKIYLAGGAGGGPGGQGGPPPNGQRPGNPPPGSNPPPPPQGQGNPPGGPMAGSGGIDVEVFSLK